MSQAGNYPDCEICEYKCDFEDVQGKAVVEPTTKDKIIQILLKMSEDDRLNIIHCGKWCSLCGSTNLPCYCAPCEEVAYQNKAESSKPSHNKQSVPCHLCPTWVGVKRYKYCPDCGCHIRDEHGSRLLSKRIL